MPQFANVFMRRVLSNASGSFRMSFVFFRSTMTPANIIIVKFDLLKCMIGKGSGSSVETVKYIVQQGNHPAS